MKRALAPTLLVGLIAMAAGFTPLAAQDKKEPECLVEVFDDGMLFPVIVDIDMGKPGSQEKQYNGGAGTKLVLKVTPGKHTIGVRHYRTGFPQLARFEVWTKNKKVWASTLTVDPRQIDLKPGQRVQVIVRQPLEPYNGRFFKGPGGIQMGLVFTRPYWDQDFNKEWKGREQYPSSLYFLVDDEKWGPEKVFQNLADATVRDIHNEKYEPKGDYRGDCHATCFVALTPDGNVPKVLLDAPKEDLKKALAKALDQAYQEMLAEKCYRPVQTAKGEIHLTFVQGHDLARMFLKKWVQKNKKPDA